MSDERDPLWFKDAIIYQTHIKAFFDSNDDGIGDFGGLIEKLDYIRDLGVTTIWLLPFYPSPLRDDGYDIQDYRAVNPSYGTMADIKQLVKEVHKRGLRLVTELVINHTSDQHPWFQRARNAPAGSKYRDYYVWSDTDQKYQDTRIIFLDTEQSNWTWDPVAKAYFWHRFYSHQPDLNFDNPVVMKEILQLLHYWLKMGIDGLRLDAIPYLIEREGTNCENLPETHDVLKRIRAEMDKHYPDKMLLAEANQWPEDTRPYFGDGDECHMAFHFPLMPRMYLALAREDRYAITDIMRQTPEIPENCQWAVFLRNHDELTLEMVTENERDFMWNTYAAEPRARINMGIRRRLAPLLEGDRRKIELMNSMLFSMPGTPVVYYGDEIGMGDNIFLGDRDGVRTPMQWSLDRNGGFSKANPQKLYLPSIMDSVYGFQAVNVEAQTNNPSSLLNWMRRIINTRREFQAFGRGTLKFLYPGNRKILAYLREYENETILCVVNLSRQAQAVELDLRAYRERVPVELLSKNPFPPIGDLPYMLTLPGYGFYWFELAEEASIPGWHTEIPAVMSDLETIVVGKDWTSMMSGREKKALENSVLPPFAGTQRWFASKDVGIDTIEIARWGEIEGSEGRYLLCELDIQSGDQSRHRYLLPLDIIWGEEQLAVGAPLLPFTLAKARRGPKMGALIDASAGEGLATALLAQMRAGDGSGQGLVFSQGAKLAEVELAEDAEIRRLGVEQSNSSIMMGREVVMKLYRRLQPGVHPEIEIARFLTDVAGFENTPPYLGSLAWVDEDGSSTALAAAYGFVANQGDGWTHTLDTLEREVERLVLSAMGETLVVPEDAFELYASDVHQLGIRTAEMHNALATPTQDPEFSAEKVKKSDLKAWTESVSAELDKAMAAIERVLPHLDEDTQKLAEVTLGNRKKLAKRVDAISKTKIIAIKTRVHGDYHLGQVLVNVGDFIILDFEGEPQRTIEERRAKLSPLKDVAGMLRSFDYAAWSVADKMSAENPDMAAILDIWQQRTSASFLAGYAEAAKELDKGVVASMNALLELHLIEKAAYEISYEAANRPSWLHIPLRGLANLADGLPKTWRMNLAND